MKIKINEVKHALSNVVGHTTTLHKRINILAIKLNVALKKIDELEKRVGVTDDDELVKQTLASLTDGDSIVIDK